MATRLKTMRATAEAVEFAGNMTSAEHQVVRVLVGPRPSPDNHILTGAGVGRKPSRHL